MPEEDLVSFADVMDMQRWNQRKLLKHLLRLYQVVQQNDAVRDVVALPRFGNLELINTELETLELGGLQAKLDRVVSGLSRKSPSDPFAEASPEPKRKRHKRRHVKNQSIQTSMNMVGTGTEDPLYCEKHHIEDFKEYYKKL